MTVEEYEDPRPRIVNGRRLFLPWTRKRKKKMKKMKDVF
ncbi:hypothetical protein R5R35_009000 [Gryllus longicercus]|uniref:Uncharacterized protein n=1 Tax=Gryllus longicercus TaxID=2509291 RepID=A0AAN9Z4B9_9ORTH